MKWIFADMRRLDCCMLKAPGQQLMHVWGDEESSFVKGSENK